MEMDCCAYFGDPSFAVDEDRGLWHGRQCDGPRAQSGSSPLGRLGVSATLRRLGTNSAGSGKSTSGTNIGLRTQ